MNRKENDENDNEKSELELLWDKKIKQIKKYVGGRPYKPDSINVNTKYLFYVNIDY